MDLGCLYDGDEQRDIVGSLLRDLEAATEPANGELGTAVDDAAAKFFQTLHVTATSFKHPGFAEEHEFRQAFNASDHQSGIRVQHRATHVGIAPYVALPISGGDRKDFLRELVVGPTPYPLLAIEGLKSWLNAEGLTAKIRKSRIPYRDW